MSRLQWYELGRFDRKTLKQLASHLTRMPYTAAARIGFQIDEVRPAVVVGRIIERIEFVETVQDPLGGKLDIQRVQYETVDFSVFDEYPHLECRSGNKAIRSLRNEIAKGLNFEISIAKIPLDIEALVKVIADRGKKIAVTRLAASNVELSEHVQAYVTASGLSGIRSALRDLLGRRKYEVAKARVCIEERDSEITCDMSHAGVISTEQQMANETVLFLRDCVRQLESARIAVRNSLRP